MGKAELRNKEGLFLTELSNEFFLRYLEEDEERGKIINEITAKVKCRIKKLGDQKNGDRGIWHCIFEESIKAYCEGGIEELLGQCLSENEMDSEFRKLMRRIYSSQSFWECDLAQKLTYNLYRLEEDNVYDGSDEEGVSDWKEGEFGRIVFTGKPKDDGDPDDLDMQIEDLERMFKQYHDLENETAVYFPWEVSEGSVKLDKNFPELNLLYIGNKRFQEFLYHEKRSDRRLELIEGQIKMLHESAGCPTQYIWEKLTNYNAICIITKFERKWLQRILPKRTQKEAGQFQENFSKKWRHLFLQIRNMPNVLTKLIFLKLVFRYIEVAPEEETEHLLQELAYFLGEVNVPYGSIQETLLCLAACVHWKLDQDTKVQGWIHKLEKEYPLGDFERWMFYLNMDDSLICPCVSPVGSSEDTRKFFKADFALHNYLSDIRLKENQAEMRKQELCKNVFSFYSKCALFERIQGVEKNEGSKEAGYRMEYIKEVSKVLQKAPCVTVTVGSEEQEREEQETPVGTIYTGVFREEQPGKEKVLEPEEAIKSIKEIIRPWVLADDAVVVDVPEERSKPQATIEKTKEAIRRWILDDDNNAEIPQDIRGSIKAIIWPWILLDDNHVIKVPELQDTVENIEAAIRPWMLSDHHEIVFEDTLGQTEEFRKMCNFLLYHFFN